MNLQYFLFKNNIIIIKEYVVNCQFLFILSITVTSDIFLISMIYCFIQL